MSYAKTSAGFSASIAELQRYATLLAAIMHHITGLGLDRPEPRQVSRATSPLPEELPISYRPRSISPAVGGDERIGDDDGEPLVQMAPPTPETEPRKPVEKGKGRAVEDMEEDRREDEEEDGMQPQVDQMEIGPAPPAEAVRQPDSSAPQRKAGKNYTVAGSKRQRKVTTEPTASAKPPAKRALRSGAPAQPVNPRPFNPALRTIIEDLNELVQDPIAARLNIFKATLRANVKKKKVKHLKAGLNELIRIARAIAARPTEDEGDEAAFKSATKNAVSALTRLMQTPLEQTVSNGFGEHAQGIKDHLRRTLLALADISAVYGLDESQIRKAAASRVAKR